MSQLLDRMRRLKVPIDHPLPDDIQKGVNSLLSQLARAGLFVVPVGELEQWLSGMGVAASKSNKWAWANDAAGVIRRMGKRTDDVWAFMEKLSEYLDRKLAATALD